ncbi:MAG: hypothetical protein OXQ27_02340 [Chloroflexota bacterium]|nr:hypothetical protein [Chloroflexota bacterium]
MRKIVMALGLAIIIAGCGGDPPTPAEATAEAVRDAARATARAEDRARRASERATREANEAAQKAREKAAEATAEANAQATKIVVQATTTAVRAEEQRTGMHCLSEWDGHNAWLKRDVEKAWDDKRDYKALETRIWPVNDNNEHYITMLFRARNEFGGVSRYMVFAYVNHDDCKVRRVENIKRQ